MEGHRVIVLCADPERRARWTARLRPAGATVVEAGTMEDARALIHHPNPQVAVVIVSQGNAPELAWVSHARSECTPSSTRVVVVCHGAADCPCHEVEADALLDVPVDDSALLSCIRNLLAPARPLPSRHRIRVVLVDDHAMLRKEFRALLESDPDIEVVGEAGDGEEAVMLAARLCPDLILMDAKLSRLEGTIATRRICETPAGPVVIGMSVDPSPEVEASMKDAGAAGFLPKTDAAEALHPLIRKVLERSLSRA